MAEAVAMFLWRLNAQTEPGVEVLLLVPTLVRNVRRVVHHHVEKGRLERHGGVIRYHARLVLHFQVQANNRALAITPEAPAVNRGIQYPERAASRVEA